MTKVGFSGCLALLSALALTMSGPGFAATWVVPTDQPTIQAGIDAAAPGDTVLVTCGTYLEHDLQMKAGISLVGIASEPGCVTIDAQGLGRVLDCQGLNEMARISNITFTGGMVIEGWFTALGGGVRCQTSQVSFTSCSFESNTARIGAGLGASESDLTLVDCRFVTNSAEHFDWSAGGAIWARDCTGTIENCQVTSNTAFSTNPDNPGDGGGFFFNNSTFQVSNSLFESNATGAGAGGFYSVTSDSSVFSLCDFVGNSAANGGAVYYEYGAAARFIDCTFQGNTATAGGAVVSFNESFPRLTGCVFENNQATQWGGGALDCWSSTAVIEDCEFLGNSAQTHGGAANFGGSTATITGSVFAGNSAVNLGGAVRAHYAGLNLEGCTLVNNAAGAGAGIHCGVSSQATVTGTIIAFSAAGESMAGLEAGFATISCSDFFGNANGDWVGDFADQLGTAGNFAADPLFCDVGVGDYALDHVSPCAAENQTACGQIGARSVGCWVSPVIDSGPPSPISAVGNFPNPFNPSTVIHFTLARPGFTSVVVYDVAGRQVQVLAAEPMSAQEHRLNWDGRTEGGHPAPAGVYFYRITSGADRKTGRMALVK
jgi:hypothetical protein